MMDSSAMAKRPASMVSVRPEPIPVPQSRNATKITTECDKTRRMCEEDADCDDGLFCNGEETCADGECQAGTNPC